MITVRTASLDDVPNIARLHVQSWQTAYRGFVPDDILSGLSIEDSIPGWRSTCKKYPGNLTIAETESCEAVGFCCAGPVVNASRSGPFGFEIYGLHVAPNLHRKGIGTQLISNALNRMHGLGLGSAIVWTLENLVQSRRFYEKHGGRLIKSGVWTIGGRSLPEVAYCWEAISRAQ